MISSPHFAQALAARPIEFIEATPQHEENGVLLKSLAQYVCAICHLSIRFDRTSVRFFVLADCEGIIARHSVYCKYVNAIACTIFLPPLESRGRLRMAESKKPPRGARASRSVQSCDDGGNAE